MTPVYFDEEERLDPIAEYVNSIKPVDQATVELDALPQEESDRIQRMQAAGQVIAQTPVPFSFDQLDGDKISTPPPSIHGKVSVAAASAGITSMPMKLDSILNMHVASPKKNAESSNAPNPSDWEGFSKADAEILSQIHQAVIDSDEKKEDVEDFFNVAAHALEDYKAIPQTDAQIIDALNRTTIEDVDHAAPHVPFPNLAHEIMKLGIGMEKFQTQNRLAKFKKEGDEHKAIIDKLLAISAQLPRMNSDDGSYTLNDDAKVKVRELAAELKEKGIDLFPGLELDEEISKEQLAAGNSLINHHIDQSRTKLQELFTTKISVSIQFLQMMNEVMKKVSELDDRAKRNAIDKVRG